MPAAGNTAPVLSSDHQDTVYLNGRPGADITDVFLFPAADPKKVVLAMDVHPLIPTGESGDVAFDPGVLYQFKATGEGTDQTIGRTWPHRVWRRARRRRSAARSVRDAQSACNAAGPLPGVCRRARRAVCLRSHAKARRRRWRQRFFIGYNVLSLVVEVPRTMPADSKGQLGVVHVWATTSVDRGGRWTQIERLGRPAIKEAFESYKQHQLTNAVTPYNGDTVLQHAVYTYMVTPKPRGPVMDLSLGAI